MFIIAQCLRIDIDITCTSQTFARALSLCLTLLWIAVAIFFHFSISNSHWFVHFSPPPPPQMFSFLISNPPSTSTFPCSNSISPCSSSLALSMLWVCVISVFISHVLVHSVRRHSKLCSLCRVCVCACVWMGICICFDNKYDLSHRQILNTHYTLTHEMLTSHSIPIYYYWPKHIIGWTEFTLSHWLKQNALESGFSVRFGNSQEKLDYTDCD